MRRRTFLVGSMAVAGSALADAWRPLFAAVPGPGPYGALGPVDGNGVELPAGFTSRIVATTGATVGTTGYPWHVAPDGGACFAVPGGGWVYTSNSEVGAGAGGASAVRFAADGTIADAYRVLSGTSRNCAGGPTPWGTWLSCEENGAGGHVWECDPGQDGQGVERPALGSFNHEAVAVDPSTGDLFLTEDDPAGRLYRFVPATPGDLATGSLFAASVSGTDVTWVPTSADAPDRQVATSAFAGGEGIWSHDGSVYFTTKGDKRVWRLVPATGTLVVFHDCVAAGGSLDAVDNITSHPATGDLYVAEDGGNMEIGLLAVVGGVSQVAAFCRVVGHTGSEITGPAFSPDGTRLYFSSQRGADGATGVTYEVTGPFRTDTGSSVPVVATLLAVDDTYVRSGAYAGASYGSSRVLSVKWAFGANYTTWSYVKFDLAGLAGPVTDARLRVFARLVTSPVLPTEVIGISDVAWSGATMTWNDQPVAGPVVGTTTVTSPTLAWHEVDVTAWVAARRAEGAGSVAFMLRPDAVSTNAVYANSREADSGQPQLVVTTDDAAPPPNLPPNAAFTTSVDGLLVTCDSSTSDDPDGTIASRAWDFGDGSSATGVVATHTYAASGTYTVRLTVVDDQGASAATTRPVAVTAPSTAIAEDDFTRTVANGFGSATVGGAWTLSGSAADFGVDGSTGHITIPTSGWTRTASLPEVSARDVDASVDLTVDKPGTGGGPYLSLAARQVGSTEYRLRVRARANGGIFRELLRVVNGSAVALVSQTVTSATIAPGTVVHLRLRVAGAGTTALSAKVWFGAEPEPTAWQVEATDATASLQQPGGVGVHAYLSSSTTNAPVVVGVDRLLVVPA